MMKRWYVAATHPAREGVAAGHLERQGFRAFLPMMTRTVRHARKLLIRQVAFFPGYLFVEFDVGRDRWRSVNGTLGVRRLITSGEKPVAVPRGFVEELLALSDASGALDFTPELRVGEDVTIVGGPFAGMIARLDRLDGQGRARVLLSVLNGEAPVMIGAEHLVPSRAEIAV